MKVRTGFSAACAAMVLVATAACSSSSGGSSGGSGSGGSGAGGSGAGGSGSGICGDVTKDQVAALFTEPVKDGVTATYADPKNPKECAFHLQSDKSLGLDLVANADIDFWEKQFTVLNPLSGVGDKAVWANNGFLVIAQKGVNNCMAQVTVSKPGQLKTDTDDNGIKADARPGFAAKLGALCTKVLG